MASWVFPVAEMVTIVTAIKLPYATGVMKLFKSAIDLAPVPSVADLTAIECDFSGYAAITLTTLPAAYPDPTNGGVSFTIPTKQWTRTLGTPDVGNEVYGGWMVNAGGDLLMIWEIDTAWPMQNVGDALPLEITENFFGTDQVYISIAGLDK